MDLQVAVMCYLQLTTLLDKNVKFRAISLSLHVALKAAVTLLDLNRIYLPYILCLSFYTGWYTEGKSCSFISFDHHGYKDIITRASIFDIL